MFPLPRVPMILLYGCPLPLGDIPLLIPGLPSDPRVPKLLGAIFCGFQATSRVIVQLCGLPFFTGFLLMTGSSCSPLGPWLALFVIKVWNHMTICSLPFLTLALFGRESSIGWEWQFLPLLGTPSLHGQGAPGGKMSRDTSFPEYT